MATLMDKLLKSGSIKDTHILSKSPYKEHEFIDTGVPIINLAFSGHLDKGFSTGLTVVAGPSGTYKTLLSLLCMKSYMDKYPEAVGILYDSEGGLGEDYSKMLDESRVIHIPIENIQELKFDLTQRLDSIERNDKVFILIDSIGNLASKKEVQDAIDEKAVSDMTRAKDFKSLFRIITNKISKRQIPCFAINHSYKTMEMYSKDVISGGCVLAGTQVRMFDGSYKSIEDIGVLDMVETLNGPKPVSHIWNPETLVEGNPECVTITFEDGFQLTCSDNHPLLTQNGWVAARDLKEDDDIISV